MAQPQGWASHSRMRVHRPARLAPSGALLARTTVGIFQTAMVTAFMMDTNIVTFWMMTMGTVLVVIIAFLMLKPTPARSMQLQRRSSKAGARLPRAA